MASSLFEDTSKDTPQEIRLAVGISRVPAGQIVFNISPQSRSLACHL